MQPGAIANYLGWMVMPDNLDLIGIFDLAVAMMKTEAIVSPQGQRLQPLPQMSIMISGNQDNLKPRFELPDQLGQCLGAGSIVDQVA